MIAHKLARIVNGDPRHKDLGLILLGILGWAPMARPFVECAFYEQFTYDSVDIATLLATASIAANQRNTNS